MSEGVQETVVRAYSIKNNLIQVNSAWLDSCIGATVLAEDSQAIFCKPLKLHSFQPGIQSQIKASCPTEGADDPNQFCLDGHTRDALPCVPM